MTIPGPDGGDGFGALLAQVQRLQENLAQSSATTHIRGSTGGGSVTIDVTGEFEFSAVHLDPTIVDPSAIDLLEDLVLAALRDAAQQVHAARQAAVGDAMSTAMSGLLGTTSALGTEDDVNDTTAH